MDGTKMPADMTLYFDVVKHIQDQINRITYANQVDEQERLNQLNRLEHEISQKFHWARRSIETAEANRVGKDQPKEHTAESSSKKQSTEMDVA